MDFQFEMLAPGHDNVGELLTLRQLNPPMFYRIRIPVFTAWYGNEGERGDSLGFPKGFGRKNTAWTLGIVTAEELEFLYTFQDTDTTIFTLGKWPTLAYGNFNAHTHIKRPTSDQWRGGVWQNIIVQHLQCEPIV